MAADRVSSGQQLVPTGARGTGGDISGFVAPLAFDSLVSPFRSPVPDDPFFGGVSAGESPVASTAGLHTVRTSSRTLTAILVANDRRVAVIDDEVVGVGDILPDGARVAAIQPNRVSIVDSQGRFQTLTLTNRGQ